MRLPFRFFDKYMANVVIEPHIVALSCPIPTAMTIAIENAFTNEVLSLEVLEPFGMGGLYQLLGMICPVVCGDQSEDQYDATWMTGRGGRIGDHS